MGGRQVQLRIGGQTYRVVTSASDDELHRLTAMVEQKLALVAPPGRVVNPNALLLAALALAHDLEAERNQNKAQLAKTRSAFGRMLERVDLALGTLEPAGGDASGDAGEDNR